MSADQLGAVARTEPGFDRFRVWGTSALVATLDPSALTEARRLLDAVLAEVDEAASRFRPGTEILRLNERAGKGSVKVSPLLFDLIAHAVWAAQYTNGACDPTVADSLVALGYDRDFDELTALAHPEHRLTSPSPAPGIGSIELDEPSSSVTLPDGVHLDLGSTAKARTADLAATRIAETLGVGSLVDLGGDLRVAGDLPHGGWAVGVVESARAEEPQAVQEVVMIHGGGVASSSNAVRRWATTEGVQHHIIDPATGRPAEPVFRLVTVAARTCVEANALSTAAMVWGEEALFELPQRSAAARLVREDDTVERIGGWPEPAEEQHP